MKCESFIDVVTATRRFEDYYSGRRTGRTEAPDQLSETVCTDTQSVQTANPTISVECLEMVRHNLIAKKSMHHTRLALRSNAHASRSKRATSLTVERASDDEIDANPRAPASAQPRANVDGRPEVMDVSDDCPTTPVDMDTSALETPPFPGTRLDRLAMQPPRTDYVGPPPVRIGDSSQLSRPIAEGLEMQYATSKLGDLVSATCSAYGLNAHVLAGAYALIKMLSDAPVKLSLPRADDPFLFFAALMIAHKTLEDYDYVDDYDDPDDFGRPVSRPKLMVLAAALDLSKTKGEYMARYGHKRGMQKSGLLVRKQLCYYEARICWVLDFPLLRREHLGPYLNLASKQLDESVAPIMEAVANVPIAHSNVSSPSIPNLRSEEEFFLPDAQCTHGRFMNCLSDSTPTKQDPVSITHDVLTVPLLKRVKTVPMCTVQSEDAQTRASTPLGALSDDSASSRRRFSVNGIRSIARKTVKSMTGVSVAVL